jgi:ankyrin repeat protein
MNRKKFINQLTFGTGLIALPQFLYSKPLQQTEQLPVDLVKEFVIAGHGNYDKTKQLLSEHQTLLYATYDWGNGDFETALEGAGHVGNKEIANYLIGLGARTNMFVLTMLGKTKIVKPFLETYPELIYARGPHGLTLLHHAQKGGDDAKELLDYLQSKGLKEIKMKL